MLNFVNGRLEDLFYLKYEKEYGSVKAREVFTKVKTSKKIETYLVTVGNRFGRPTCQGILSQLSTIPYFIFRNGETLCMAAIFVLTDWRQLFNQECYILTEEEVTRVAVDIISYCSKSKFNKTDNFFIKFYTDIDELGREDELESLIEQSANLETNKQDDIFVETFQLTDVLTCELSGDVGFQVLTNCGRKIVFWKSNLDQVVEAVDATTLKIKAGTKLIPNGDGRFDLLGS